MLSVNKSSAARKCPLQRTHRARFVHDGRVSCLFPLILLSFSFFWLCIASGVLCVVRLLTSFRGPGEVASECLMQPQMGRCIIQSALAPRSIFPKPQLTRVQLVSWHCPVLAAKVACYRSQHLAESVFHHPPSWSSSRLRNGPSKWNHQTMVPIFSLLHSIKPSSALCSEECSWSTQLAEAGPDSPVMHAWCALP